MYYIKNVLYETIVQLTLTNFTRCVGSWRMSVSPLYSLRCDNVSTCVLYDQLWSQASRLRFMLLYEPWEKTWIVFALLHTCFGGEQRKAEGTATQCDTLQRIATHFNSRQPTATHSNPRWPTATRCNTLPHVATHCTTHKHIYSWSESKCNLCIPVITTTYHIGIH